LETVILNRWENHHRIAFEFTIAGGTDGFTEFYGLHTKKNQHHQLHQVVWIVVNSDQSEWRYLSFDPSDGQEQV
jgi:hypothetical protein